MNLALAWKEWRDHRLIWLAVAGLAVLAVGGAYLSLAPLGRTSVAGDQGLQAFLAGCLLILAVAYAVVCGAMMFAGEREAGTLVFIDRLAGRRALVWRTKALVGGLLTAAQVTVLLGLGQAIGLAHDEANFWGWAALLSAFALEAYAWGLFASSLWPATLGAAGLAALFLAGSWLLSPLLALPLVGLFRTHGGVAVVLTLFFFAAVGLVASCLAFCRLDRQRRVGKIAVGQCAEVEPRPWQVLFWLAYRQGLAVVGVLAPVVFVLGVALPVPGLVLWPVTTWLIGLTCGATVFAGEQRGAAYRLLGNGRLPLGRVWAAKTLGWLGVTAGLGLLLLLGMFLRVTMTGTKLDRFGRLTEWGSLDWLRLNEVLPQTTPVLLFLPLWGLYGFATGLVVVQLVRKTVVAVLLAAVVSAGALALWVPSLVMGGVSAWQLGGFPVFLLAASGLAMRPWAGDRLYTPRPLLAVLGWVVVALACLAGGLVYRVVEVPDVGEPFDVQGFLASLPTPEQNQAGRLMRRAAGEMKDYERQVTAKLGPPKEPLFPLKDEVGPGVPDGAGGMAAGAGGPGGQGRTKPRVAKGIWTRPARSSRKAGPKASTSWAAGLTCSSRVNGPRTTAPLPRPPWG